MFTTQLSSLNSYDYFFERMTDRPLTWVLLCYENDLISWRVDDPDGMQVVQKAFKKQHNISLKPLKISENTLVLTMKFKNTADEALFLLKIN